MAPLILIFYLLKVKVLNIAFFAIGHLAMDVDQYIKEGYLGIRPKHIGIALCPHLNLRDVSGHANKCLVDYWRQHIKIFKIKSRVLYELVLPFFKNKSIQHNMKNTHFYYAMVQNKWDSNQPLLSLTEKHLKKGNETLRKIGFPDDAWFVCLHVRESSFKPTRTYHNYRDADIDTYTLACQEIIKRGGWVFRMGDPSTKLYSPFEQVIDYAHSSYRCDEMDIFLCARCKIFLGSSSGIIGVPTIFNVPIIMTNAAPLSAISYTKGDLNLIKMIWNKEEKRYLTFKEILTPKLNDINTMNYFNNLNCIFIDNSPEEIRDVTIEMLDSLSDSNFFYSEKNNNLQLKYISLLKQGQHLGYGTRARMGRDFLKKYEYLLSG